LQRRFWSRNLDLRERFFHRGFFAITRIFIEPTAHRREHLIELGFAARQKVFLRLSLILRLAQLFASGLV
jgi:hypothetical protein